MCVWLLQKCIGKWYTFVLQTIISGLFSLFDVYSDVIVMIQWWSNGDYYWASGILFFLLLSHVWTAKVTYEWMTSRGGGKRQKAQSAKASRPDDGSNGKLIVGVKNNQHLVIHMIMSFFGFIQFQSLYIFNIVHKNIKRDIAHKAQKRPHEMKKMLAAMRVKLSRFKFIESTFESIPNGALQIYFIYYISNGDLSSIDINKHWFTIISILLSIVSVGRGISKWIRLNAIRNALTRGITKDHSFRDVFRVDTWYVDAILSLYFATDYVVRVLSMVFIWIVCRDEEQRWAFVIVMLAIVPWEAVCCKIVTYFWLRGEFAFKEGLAQDKLSYLFHIIASVFTAYYYNGIRPSTIGSVAVLFSRFVINLILFFVYYTIHSHDGFVENWNLIYGVLLIVNLGTMFVWTYIKYKTIRLLYWANQRSASFNHDVVMAQTAVATAGGVDEISPTVMKKEEDKSQIQMAIQPVENPSQELKEKDGNAVVT